MLVGGHEIGQSGMGGVGGLWRGAPVTWFRHVADLVDCGVMNIHRIVWCL